MGFEFEFPPSGLDRVKYKTTEIRFVDLLMLQSGEYFDLIVATHSQSFLM